MIFSYEGKAINYESRGEGRSTVLLLHGYMESIYMWDFLVPQLSEHCKVIAVDLPGHGNSEMLDKVLTMPEMAEVIVALLAELKIENVAICGHSMGGYVALALASEYPKVVSKLVLYHSTAFADNDETKLRRKLGQDLLTTSPKTAIRASFSRLFYNHDGIEDQIDFYINESLKGNFEAYISANNGMAQREDLGEVWLEKSGHMSYIEEMEMARSILLAILP